MADDELTIDELRAIVEADPRGDWIEPGSDPASTIIFGSASSVSEGEPAAEHEHDSSP